MQHGGPGQQPLLGQGKANNMGTMSQMMNDMHQMMMQGQMPDEHQKQMMEMMNQMGQMMQQMSGPHNPQMEQQHGRQLSEMQKRLHGMKSR
jgi:hypothetical protein